MRVRVSSWVLACLFIIFGLWCVVIIPKFVGVFSELKMDVPYFTSVILSPTPAGWLLISFALAAVIVWKDRWMRVRLKNSLFVVVLAIGVMVLATALFLPNIVDVQTLGN